MEKEENMKYVYQDSCFNLKKPDYSDYRYKKMKSEVEFTTGEVLVDPRGYVPLQQLLLRCGLGREKLRTDWITDECGVDKFNDRLEMQQKINDLLNNNVGDIENVNNRTEPVPTQEQSQQSVDGNS